MTRTEIPRTFGRFAGYHVGVADALGSIPAAILWHHLGWASTPNEAGWCTAPPDNEGWFACQLTDLASRLGFGVAQLRAARALLEEAGWVETQQRGLPARLLWRIAAVASQPDMRESQNWDAKIASLDAKTAELGCENRKTLGAKIATHTFSKGFKRESKSGSDFEENQERPKAPAKPQVELLPRSAPTQASILAGQHDRVPIALGGRNEHPDALPLAEACVAAWGARWGHRRPVLSSERRKTWATWGREGRPPSEILKAILGMSHDDSPADRNLHHDWTHVARNFEKWVALYEEREGHVAPRWPRRAAPAGHHDWEGVYLPRSAPTDADRFCRANGYVFVLDAAAWVDPLADTRGTITAHRAKWGEINITPESRTAMALANKRAAKALANKRAAKALAEMEAEDD